MKLYSKRHYDKKKLEIEMEHKNGEDVNQNDIDKHPFPILDKNDVKGLKCQFH